MFLLRVSINLCIIMLYYVEENIDFVIVDKFSVRMKY